MNAQAAAATPPIPDQMVKAAIAQIDRSHNYRKTYDDQYLAGLAESVRAVGVIEPVILRPNQARGKDGKPWILIAGECRIRASIAAGLIEVPAIIKHGLDDAGARELSIIENLQRKNVDPLEEADGIRELYEPPHSWPVERIADRIGQKRSYVYHRLKLCSLCEPARKAYRAGKIDVSVAVLVARIPGDAAQKEALAAIDKMYDPTYDQVARLVHDRFMRRLAGAPFDAADEKLVPAAGSCAKCPKRTGNQRELFGDVKSADVCTDPACYRSKADAVWKIRAAEAEKKGARVLDDAAATKLFPYQGQLAHAAPFVDLDEECYEDQKARKYRKLVAKGTPVVLARDPLGQVHELVAKSDLPAAMKASGVKLERAATRTAGGDAEAKFRKEQEKQRTVTRAVIAAIVDKAVPNAVMIRALIDVLASGGYSNAIADVVARRGWTKKGENKGVTFEQRVEALKPGEVFPLLVEVIIARNAYFSHASGLAGSVKDTAIAAGVDVKAVEKRALAELAEARKAKKKGGRK